MMFSGFRSLARGAESSKAVFLTKTQETARGLLYIRRCTYKPSRSMNDATSVAVANGIQDLPPNGIWANEAIPPESALPVPASIGLSEGPPPPL